MTALSNQYVAGLFDAAAAQYDQSSNPYTVLRRVEALSALALGDCLEIGGGTGVVSGGLKAARSVIHSDIAPEMCRVAQRKWKIPSLCFDAETMPFPNQTFDTVISSEMIYYLQRPQACLAEAFRVLRPGGRMLICTTNPLAAVWEKGRTLLRRIGLPGMFFDDGAPKFISLSRLRAMSLSVGFTAVSARHIIPLPFAFCDLLNRGLERTPLSRLGLFLILEASKDQS